MRLRATLLGSPRLARKLRMIPEQTRQRVAGAIAESAETLRQELRRELSRTGPSRAGQAPARRSGALAESITVEIAPDGLGAEIGSDLDYARHLELGTRRMAARPWLRPTIQRLAPRIARRLRAAVQGKP